MDCEKVSARPFLRDKLTSSVSQKRNVLYIYHAFVIVSLRTMLLFIVADEFGTGSLWHGVPTLALASVLSYSSLLELMYSNQQPPETVGLKQ